MTSISPVSLSATISDANTVSSSILRSASDLYNQSFIPQTTQHITSSIPATCIILDVNQLRLILIFIALLCISICMLIYLIMKERTTESQSDKIIEQANKQAENIVQQAIDTANKGKQHILQQAKREAQYRIDVADNYDLEIRASCLNLKRYTEQQAQDLMDTTETSLTCIRRKSIHLAQTIIQQARDIHLITIDPTIQSTRTTPHPNTPDHSALHKLLPDSEFSDEQSDLV